MQFFIDFFTNYGYFAVFFVLLLCGMGVPIPEDITLVSGGIISGLGYANPHWMVVVGMIGVLFGDSLMYLLGRVYGVKILRFRLVKRFITFKRLKMVKDKFDRYGNRLLFFARFLPGLRTPVYIITGITRRVGFVRFLLIDFSRQLFPYRFGFISGIMEQRISTGSKPRCGTVKWGFI